ncbi:MAG: N-acetylmuramoyl-L-alanine amidase [Urechidicola sp.]
MNLHMFHKFNTKTKAIRVFVLFFIFIQITLTGFSQDKIFTVVLDAGHGGHDPGNIGYKKYIEKDIALKIVLEVGNTLESNRNINVIYTRKTDVFVNLWERGNIANKADADLFVSVHCNGHHTDAYGAENWALGPTNKKNFEIAKKENEVILLEENYKENYKGFDPNSPESFIGISIMAEEYLDQSLQLASIIQGNFTNKLKRKDRGVKQAAFVVLYQTYMPSVLIETGFLTNKTEGAYLNTKIGQSKFANAISDGIKEYLEQIRENTVENRITEDQKDASENINKDIVFKVQLASGSRKVQTKSYNFNGLKNVERVKVGKYYKYYLGNTSDYSLIKEQHTTAKGKGYSTAFIVAFKKGKKISVKEALKTTE